MNAITHGHTAGDPAPTPTGMVETLIGTAERLADVLQRETELLREMNLGDAAAVQLEKATLAEIYEKSFRDIQADNGALAAAMPGRERAALRAAGERLAGASTDNERALRAVREVNERVLAAIVDAAREQRSANHAYGQHGFGGTTGALSLAVDRQL